MSHFTVTVITVIINRESLAMQTLFSIVVFDLFYLLSDPTRLSISVVHFSHFYLLFLYVFTDYLLSFVYLPIDLHFCRIFPFICLFVCLQSCHFLLMVLCFSYGVFLHLLIETFSLEFFF